MTAATRSLFTEAIEEHLALKRQNASLAGEMPLDRFDVGDPLDRYPGGPVRPALGADKELVLDEDSALATSPEERAFGAPMGGMAPSLSLVEDLEDMVGAEEDGPVLDIGPQPSGEVLRFPGGVGVGREDSAFEGDLALSAAPTMVMEATDDDSADEVDDTENTSEQPVIVIDADEPLAGDGGIEPMAPRTSRRTSGGGGGGLFGGLRRKKKSEDENAEGWFSATPRDFRWDD